MAVETLKVERPKFPLYVSKHNGSIHPAQTNPPGYEDKHLELYVGAVDIEEAKRLSLTITGNSSGDLGAMVDAMTAADTAAAALPAAPVAVPPPAPLFASAPGLDLPPAPATFLPEQ